MPTHCTRPHCSSCANGNSDDTLTCSKSRRTGARPIIATIWGCIVGWVGTCGLAGFERVILWGPIGSLSVKLWERQELTICYTLLVGHGWSCLATTSRAPANHQLSTQHTTVVKQGRSKDGVQWRPG